MMRALNGIPVFFCNNETRSTLSQYFFATANEIAVSFCYCATGLFLSQYFFATANEIAVLFCYCATGFFLSQYFFDTAGESMQRSFYPYAVHPRTLRLRDPCDALLTIVTFTFSNCDRFTLRISLFNPYNLSNLTWTSLAALDFLLQSQSSYLMTSRYSTGKKQPAEKAKAAKKQSVGSKPSAKVTGFVMSEAMSP
jgi:hypothetical protein